MIGNESESRAGLKRLLKYRGKTIINCLFACLLYNFFVPARATEPTLNFQFAEGEVRDAIQYFPLPSQPESYATLRIGRIYKDFESKGFFRIGVLPLVAIEGFDLEAPSSESATDCFEQIQSFLLKHARGARRIELRKVRVAVGMTATNILECGRVWIEPDGKWELLDDVSVRAGKNQMKTSNGTLQVSGKAGGRLLLNGLSTVSLNFFSTNLSDQIGNKGILK